MKILAIYCLLSVLFAIPVTTFAGAKIGDIRVTAAFKHEDSGNMVINVEVYLRDSDLIGSQPYWSNNEGRGGLYWGNIEEGFFKIHLQSTMSEAYTTHVSTQNILFAPTLRDANRVAALNVQYTYRNSRKKRDQLEGGNLEVSCARSKVCLAFSKDAIKDVNTALKKGEVELIDLPDVRTIGEIFRIPDKEQYIIVEFSKLNPKEIVEILFWNQGELSFLDVKHVERQNGTTYIYLEDGQTITYGGTFGNDAHQIALTNENTIRRPLVRMNAGDSDLISKLQLPAIRYKQPVLRTPCEILF